MTSKNHSPKAEALPIAFVAMTFDKRLQPVYQKVLKPLLDEYGYKCTRADEEGRMGIVVDQIKEVIQNASLVICDLTFDNPNVYYELGIAHSLGKEPLLISQQAADLPFDVRHLRVITYEDEKFGLLDLREKLAAFLKALPQGGRKSGSPARGIVASPDELDNQRAALFSPSVNYKRWALKYLGDNQDKSSFEQINQMAIDSSLGDDVRRDAFTALQKIDEERAFPVLVRSGLRFQPAHLVRERVVELLGEYKPDKKTEEIYVNAPRTLLDQMLRQTGDSSWGVRKAVCEVLGRWRSPKAVGQLRILLHDGEAQVSLAAVEALGRFQEDQLGDKEPQVRMEAAAALDRIGEI